MKVLHITNWYYSKEEPEKVPFIKEHLEALQLFCENEIVHVEVKSDTKTFYQLDNYRLGDWEEAFVLRSRLASAWRVKEWMTHRLLLKVLKQFDVNNKYDVLNIHTAYPLCTYTKKILKYLEIPVVFTEHWTAFYFNFNLPKDTNKLNRIKNIYHHNIPVITVSKALGDDIRRFSGNTSFKNYIVPNVVRTELFNHKKKALPKVPTFYMLNCWRKIKSPFVLLGAFKTFLEKYPNAQLKVGGYGPLWEDMEKYVAANKLQSNIEMLGYMEKEQTAEILQTVTAFIHAAAYETFSVVNAEALMCGAPVVVSNIPAVAEFVHEENGILISDNREEVWVKAFEDITKDNQKYNRQLISREVTAKFSKNAVGKTYYETLLEVKKNYNQF
jgi:glycosyltransferase involved in cell wall biosynthesis